MPLVQIRDVPEATVNALRARAAEQGLTLGAYSRAQLDRLARRPMNAEIVKRLARCNRNGSPTVDETVAKIRRLLGDGAGPDRGIGQPPVARARRGRGPVRPAPDRL